MKSVGISAFVVLLSCIIYAEGEHVSNVSLDCINFYWRSYGKIIPVDAVVGGHDGNGNEIYVGRGALWNTGKHEVAPLGINSTAEVQVGALLSPVVASNVEILCAYPLSEVRWVKTSCRNIDNILKKEYPIVAGVDFNLRYKLFIGRIEHQGQLLVGKVVIFKSNKAALYFISNNRYHYVIDKEIEILVANV